jgi:hypothetical protein
MKALEILKELAEGKSFYFSGTPAYYKHIKRMEEALKELEAYIEICNKG